MRRNTFQQLRFTLFASSYCGRHLAKVLKARYWRNRIMAGREVKLLANTLNLKGQWLVAVIKRDKDFRHFLCPSFFVSPRDAVEIPIFLAIESEMTEILENRFMDDLLEVDDYPGAVLQSAVERAAGNKLTEVENEGQFEEQLEKMKGHYLYCYYRVAYRYKLPTLRILPFILRLITLR